MTLSISSLQVYISEPYMLTQGFRNLLENHLLFLRRDNSTSYVTLNAHDEYKYIGDFYQLIQHLGVPQDLWWLTMRMNELHSPLDYNGNLGNILVPNISKITTMLTKYMNTTSIL